MPIFHHDQLSFRYRDQGTGPVFLFQHGLGGDLTQPLGLYPPRDGLRLISMDCRGHGETRPLGEPEKLRFDTFSDDLAALLRHRGVRQAVWGGISMGAALALNGALRHRGMARGLVLVRPAWVDGPGGTHLQVFPLLGRLLREFDPPLARQYLEASLEYALLREQCLDSAETLLRLLDEPRATETAAKYERIPADSPCPPFPDWASLDIPALILACREDPVHPYELGEQLAARLPRAEFQEITPKSRSLRGYTNDLRGAINSFFARHFPGGQ